jgi:hypothetical protein
MPAGRAETQRHGDTDRIDGPPLISPRPLHVNHLPLQPLANITELIQV